MLVELRRLSRPVPRPLSLPSPERVAEVEEHLGLRLHGDLRRYLSEASDVVFGTLEPITIMGGAHTDLQAVVAYARAAGVPSDLVPICEDNGDFYCMTASGEVVYWSHNGLTNDRWPDLAAWIEEVWLRR